MGNDDSSAWETSGRQSEIAKVVQTGGMKVHMRIPINSRAPLVSGALLVLAAVLTFLELAMQDSFFPDSLHITVYTPENDYLWFAIYYTLSAVFLLISISSKQFLRISLLFMSFGAFVICLTSSNREYNSGNWPESMWVGSQWLVGLVGVLLLLLLILNLPALIQRALKVSSLGILAVAGILAVIDLFASKGTYSSSTGDYDQLCFYLKANGFSQDPFKVIPDIRPMAALVILVPFLLFLLALANIIQALSSDTSKKYYEPVPRPVKALPEATVQEVIATPVPLYTMVVMPDGTQQMMQVVQPTETTAKVNMQSASTKDRSTSRKGGVITIISGVAVFVVCCIVQAACGSSMFSRSYYSTGVVSDILINITWYPGWTVSILLVCSGVVALFIPKKKS